MKNTFRLVAACSLVAVVLFGGVKAISLLSPVSVAQAAKPVPNQGPAIRVIYLVPSDRTTNNLYTKSVQSAYQNLDLWFQSQLISAQYPQGLRLRLYSPIVTVYKTAHPVSYYTGDGSPGNFWEKSLADGFAVSGGKFDDPDNRWIYYIDAEPLAGQYTGGTNGVALMPRHDLVGLAGKATDGTTVNRWIGGSGHEMGHALGLPHPPGCDTGTATIDCQKALMYLGYQSYPDAFLTDDDKLLLQASPFLKAP